VAEFDVVEIDPIDEDTVREIAQEIVENALDDYYCDNGKSEELVQEYTSGWDDELNELRKRIEDLEKTVANIDYFKADRNHTHSE
jgi:hypothetical protein